MNSSSSGTPPSPSTWICEITRWLAAGGSVPEHTPPLQTSPLVHPFPSSHATALLACTQPEPGLQESFVHGLLSLQLSAGPPRHDPPAHVSLVVQLFPSLQDAVLFALTQPVAGLHESFVHGFASAQFGASPPTQTPAAHASPVVQALPSLHGLVLFV